MNDKGQNLIFVFFGTNQFSFYFISLLVFNIKLELFLIDKTNCFLITKSKFYIKFRKVLDTKV